MKNGDLIQEVRYGPSIVETEDGFTFSEKHEYYLVLETEDDSGVVKLNEIDPDYLKKPARLLRLPTKTRGMEICWIRHYYLTSYWEVVSEVDNAV